jgi:hypothetical protein
MPLPCWS